MSKWMKKPLKAVDKKNGQQQTVSDLRIFILYSLFWDYQKKPIAFPPEQPQNKSPFLAPHNRIVSLDTDFKHETSKLYKMYVIHYLTLLSALQLTK